MISYLRSRTAGIRRTRRGLLRVVAYFSFVMVVILAFGMRRARAEFNNQTLELGRQMAALALTKDHEVTGIRFNGQLMQVGSTVTDATPDQVLKNYENYCRNASVAFFKEGLKTGPNDPTQGIKEGFMRVGEPGANEGAVICFVKGPSSLPTRAESITEFKKTGRLGAIGELRYAYASKSEISGRTLVLTAWTDSNFNLLQIAPPARDTDAPGNDIDGVPRAPTSLRIISASAEGTPIAANVYKTKLAPEKVIEFYDHEMQTAGWQIIDPGVEGTLGHGYLKDGVVTIANTKATEDGTYYALSMSGVTERDKMPERR